MRTSRKQVEGVFALLCKACSRTVGYGVGEWHLDYSSIYGGFVICEKVAGGGETCPLGLERRKPSEMWACLSFALRIKDISP